MKAGQRIPESLLFCRGLSGFYGLLIFLYICTSATANINAQINITNHQLMQIDSLAKRAITDGKTAGLSAAIAVDGKLILSRGYGYADLEKRIPAGTETIYPVASITKQFTAVCILQLAEKGKLSLEDSLTKYLHDYPVDGYNITIHELLNHTSGIKSITSLGEKYWSQIGKKVTPKELVKMFSSEPFDFEPGEDYSYSNSDYILLGVIIEKVSGITYGDYLKKNIFKPFGLKNTFYYPDLKDTARLTGSYSHKENEFLPAVYVHPTQGYSMGGIVSTSEDLIKWLQLLHSGEIIGSSYYRKMINPDVLKSGERISYGYGVGVGEFLGHRLLFHAGGIFGADAQSIYFPDERLSIVLLANTDDADVVGLENKISGILLGVGKVQEVKLPGSEMLKYAGTYKFRTAEVKILYNNDSLYIAGLWGNDPVRLKYIGENTFYADGQLENLQFILDENSVVKMRLVHYGARIAEFKKTD